ncbi:MAG: hypothetical protein D6731_01870, partial [Planctomycetota bacterium]
MAVRSPIEVFQLDEQEVFVPAAVAWLLDPAERHGLGPGLVHRLADFLAARQPGLAAALRAGPWAVRLVRPGPLPRIELAAGRARLALVSTILGAPGPADRPPPGVVPVALDYDAARAQGLEVWPLGAVAGWLATVEVAPRWRNFAKALHAHLEGELAARGLEPLPPVPAAPSGATPSGAASPAPAQPTAPRLGLGSESGPGGGGTPPAAGLAYGGLGEEGYGAGGFADAPPEALAGPAASLADRWELAELEAGAAEPAAGEAAASPEPA